MWTIILLLWLIPLALGILILVRAADGTPAITEEERRLFFGEAEEMTVSLWVGLKFALISVLFFFVGLFEGLVLINLGPVWFVLVPLVTGLGAILLLQQLVRSASSEKQSSEQRVSQRNTARSRASVSRARRMLSR
jgi:TctA family transporter